MANAGDNMPMSIFWLLGGWVIVVLVALVWGVTNAETTLRDDARQQLVEDGHDIFVDFSGRDARLVGGVDSQEVADEIEASIEALPGVRKVRNEIVVVEPPPAQPREPEIAVRFIGQVVSISGLVPDEETESELIEAISAQYGDDNVVNALLVADDVEIEPWLGRIEDVFAPLTALRSGMFTADSDGIVVTGEVISDAVARDTRDALELVLGDYPVTIDLSIAILPAPTFAASGRGGAIVLEGTLPSDEVIERINDAAERLFGGAVIVDVMRVGPVAGSQWLESIEGLLDVATRLDPWTIEVVDGEATLSGFGEDQDVVAAIEVLLEGVAGDQLSVVTDVELAPGVVATELTSLLQGSAAFDTNGVTLTAEGIGLLDTAIELLQANPATVLVVEGHTDNQGEPAANLELSRQRAEAVVDYLVAGGIDPERLSAVGYGEQRPIADNTTDEGRAQNRRIEFVIREGDE